MKIADTICKQQTGQLCRDVIGQSKLDLQWLKDGKMHYGQLDRIADRMERKAAQFREMAAQGPQCEAQS